MIAPIASMHFQKKKVIRFKFIKAQALTKKDWLMCPACELPQVLFETVHDSQECATYLFRVDLGCIHCGCRLDADAEFAAQYDVVNGKALRSFGSLTFIQELAIIQYDNLLLE